MHSSKQRCCCTIMCRDSKRTVCRSMLVARPFILRHPLVRMPMSTLSSRAAYVCVCVCVTRHASEIHESAKTSGVLHHVYSCVRTLRVRR